MALPGAAEGLREGKGFAALIGGQIAVARAQGKAVRVADCGADGDFDGKVEVAGHGAEDGDLGGVLLAEEGAVRLEDVEELGDDGADAAEVAGAGLAVEAVAQVAWIDESAQAARGVHLRGHRSEDQVYAFFFEEVEVGVERAGVAGEVFIGAELGGVDEDGGGYVGAGLAGGADEAEVALVESAHSGDEAQRCLRGSAESTEGGAGFGDGGEELHASTGSAASWSRTARGRW